MLWRARGHHCRTPQLEACAFGRSNQFSLKESANHDDHRVLLVFAYLCICIPLNRLEYPVLSICLHNAHPLLKGPPHVALPFYFVGGLEQYLARCVLGDDYYAVTIA